MGTGQPAGAQPLTPERWVSMPATIYLLAALAGRIYRNSVLRVGRRVKLSEALGLVPSGKSVG